MIGRSEGGAPLLLPLLPHHPRTLPPVTGRSADVRRSHRPSTLILLGNDEKESKPSKSVLEPSDEMVRLRTEARRREEAEAERVRHLLRTGHVPPPLERPRPTAPALPGPGGPRGNDDRGHSGGVRDKMRDSGW